MAEYKNISDLSFLTKDQKEIFKNYIISDEGIIFNKNTYKNISNTIHGTRGYVANLSVKINGIRFQRQIVIHRAIADLFIRPIKNGEKLCFIDNDKTNVRLSNIAYRFTETKRKEEYGKCVSKVKGITDDGRICNKCGEFKEWGLMSLNSSAICKTCASKRGVKYQKQHKYSEQPVPYETYSLRFSEYNPINIDNFLGFACETCNREFKISRGNVVNKLKSIKIKHIVQSFVCKKCKKGENNEI